MSESNITKNIPITGVNYVKNLNIPSGQRFFVYW
jgi:hypothetical protein